MHRAVELQDMPIEVLALEVEAALVAHGGRPVTQPGQRRRFGLPQKTRPDLMQVAVFISVRQLKNTIEAHVNSRAPRSEVETAEIALRQRLVLTLQVLQSSK